MSRSDGPKLQSERPSGLQTPGGAGDRARSPTALRTERRPEPFVGELVAVDRRNDRLVVAARRRQADAAVIAQRRIERTPADREHRDQPLQPVDRHEIEQRRRGHEVGVVGERALRDRRRDRPGRSSPRTWRARHHGRPRAARHRCRRDASPGAPAAAARPRAWSSRCRSRDRRREPRGIPQTPSAPRRARSGLRAAWS